MEKENKEDENTGNKYSWAGWNRKKFNKRFNRERGGKYNQKHDHFHDTFTWREWDHEHTHWFKHAEKQRGLFFLRTFSVFALIIFLGLGGIGAFVYLINHLIGGGGNANGLVWILGCSLSLALPLLAAGLAGSVFRGVATPIADVMTAAEAIGQGDLSVRVPLPEHGPDDLRRLADSFNNMIEALARLDEQRRNLTADIAHELRTPLHIIQGNLEGILDGVYKPTIDQINTLLDETKLLTCLVQDLQTLSLVDAGKLTLKIEPVDIPELLHDIQTSFSYQMEAANINFQVQIRETSSFSNKNIPAEESSMIINADPSRLDQILSNLVANAIRYTKEGGKIVLRAWSSPSGVTIQVTDNGEGISEKDLPFIFDRFWKGDRSRSRIEGAGSGLGLAISRKLVKAHGGHIGVESKQGVGTTFTIELPNQ